MGWCRFWAVVCRVECLFIGFWKFPEVFLAAFIFRLVFCGFVQWWRGAASLWVVLVVVVGLHVAALCRVGLPAGTPGGW